MVKGDHALASPATTLLVESFLLGVAVGVRWPWFPVTQIVVPVLLTEGNSGGWFWSAPETWVYALPFIGGAFLGAMRQPLIHFLRRLDANPRDAFISLQLLNVADAVLTGVGLERGDVIEANPVVRVIGMPLKIIIVGFAGWWVYRWRPRALLAPVVVLTGVLAYHLGGLVVNAH